MLGLDRHQWGYIHLVLGYVLLGLLVLHIIFHWRQIKGMLMLMIPSNTGKNVFLSVMVLLFAVFLLFAFVSPIVLDPIHEGAGRRQADIVRQRELGSGGRGQQMTAEEQADRTAKEGEAPAEKTREEILEEARIAAGRGEESASQGAAATGGRGQESRQEVHSEYTEHQLDINGTYTLGEVASRYDVPSSVIKEGLGIPASASDRERLGRLRRQYGFYMSDVEKIILDYKNE